MKKIYAVCCSVLVALSCSMHAKVHKIHTHKEFNDLISTSENPLLIKYSAQWCGACKRIAEPFDAVSNEPEFKKITFVDVDVDEVPDVSKEKHIVGIPTFHYVYNGVQKKQEIGVRDPNTFSDTVRANLRSAFALARNDHKSPTNKAPLLLAANDHGPEEMDEMLNDQKSLGSVKDAQQMQAAEGDQDEGMVQKAWNWVKDGTKKAYDAACDVCAKVIYTLQ